MLKRIKNLAFLFMLVFSSNAWSDYTKKDLDSLPLEITIASYKGNINPMTPEVAEMVISKPFDPKISNSNEIETIGGHPMLPNLNPETIAFLPKGTLDRQRLAPFITFINSRVMEDLLVGGKFRINREGDPEIKLTNGQVVNESNIELANFFVPEYDRSANEYSERIGQKHQEIKRLKKIEKKYTKLHNDYLSCDARQNSYLQEITIFKEENVQRLKHNKQAISEFLSQSNFKKDHKQSSINDD